MLKKRIIATILVDHGIAVQSYGFSRRLPIGSPVIAAEYLDRWGADEIVLLDIAASKRHTVPDPRLIEKVSRACSLPVAVGGGISTLAQIAELMSAGADKVVVNTAFLRQASFVSAAAHRYGRQCVIVSIDAVAAASDRWAVYSATCPDRAGEPVGPLAAHAQEQGAGEIMIGSVDRDGTRRGFDLGLARHVRDHVSVPLIAVGGAGCPRDFLEVLEVPATAAAAGNYFHYFEHSIALAKKAMSGDGADVRMSHALGYQRHKQSTDARVISRPADSPISQEGKHP